jgi:hypothetical protein
MVRPVSATRRRLPGGSFIWPYTIATLEFEIVLVDDAGLDHLVIKIVAFAGALADAGEHRQAAVLLGDVVDQLEHVDGLADAGAAEQADLAALGERHQQVDHLDAGDQQVLAAGLLIVGRRRRWIGQCSLVLTGPRLSCGSPSTSMMRPSVPVADRHRDARAGGLTGRPRFRPSEAPIAMVRTTPSPSCCCTSSVSVAVLQLERLVDLRDRSRGNSTSMTAPMICVILPVAMTSLPSARRYGSASSQNLKSSKAKPPPRRRRSPPAPW